jgi:hypothetical protein
MPVTGTEKVTRGRRDLATLRAPVPGVTFVIVGLTGAGAALGAGLGAGLVVPSGGSGLGPAFGSGLGLGPSPGLALGSGDVLGPGLGLGLELGAALDDGLGLGLGAALDDGLGIGLATDAGTEPAAATATAAPTCRRPNPESGFCPPATSGLADCSSASFTAATPRDGFTARMRATAAVTCGVAMDVPDHASY